MKTKRVNKNTLLSEVVEINEDAREILFDEGMHCIGCPMSKAETLEEGCLSHGMSPKEIDELIKKINDLK